MSRARLHGHSRCLDKAMCLNFSPLQFPSFNLVVVRRFYADAGAQLGSQLFVKEGGNIVERYLFV